MKRALRRLIRGVWFWWHMSPVIWRMALDELDPFRDAPNVLVRFWCIYAGYEGQNDSVNELYDEATDEWLNRKETAQRGF